MPVARLNGRRWFGTALLVLIRLFAAQSAMAVAAGPDTYAGQPIYAQATATPFRFLTPTPFVSRPTTSTTTSTSTTTAPRAGGIPLEMVVPALAGGFAAIGGGTLLLRRKGAR